MIRPVPEKTQAEIQAEWDRIAMARHEQISSGLDLSFEHVLCPAVDKLVGDSSLERVLDVGCGTGELTKRLAHRAGAVVGIDISHESVRLAKYHNSADNIQYVRDSIENFSNLSQTGFSHAVSNMTLMTILDLIRTLEAIRRLLERRAVLAFTITHPWFWPTYWGYGQEPWFDYLSEIRIEAPFRISLLQDSELTTTHVHRPLSMYTSALSHAGFSVEQLIEPMPKREVMLSYPEPWRYPRFLGGRAIAT